MNFLEPINLPKILIYDKWNDSQIQLNEQTLLNIQEGQIENIGCKGKTYFAKLPSIVSRNEVASILKLVKSITLNLPKANTGLITEGRYEYNVLVSSGVGTVYNIINGNILVYSGISSAP